MSAHSQRVDLASAVSLVCWIFRHRYPLTGVGPKGVRWICPDCQRWKPSVLKHLKPGHIA